MKNYRQKKRLSASVYLAIVFVAIIIQYIKGFRFELTALAVLILIFSFRDFRKSFSTELLRKGLVEELDERNELISQRSNAMAFTVVQNVSIGLEILLIILYGAFREPILLSVILTLSLVIAISFASSIISSIYFEKRL